MFCLPNAKCKTHVSNENVDRMRERAEKSMKLIFETKIYAKTQQNCISFRAFFSVLYSLSCMHSWRKKYLFIISISAFPSDFSKLLFFVVVIVVYCFGHTFTSDCYLHFIDSLLWIEQKKEHRQTYSHTHPTYNLSEYEVFYRCFSFSLSLGLIHDVGGF